MSIRTRFAPSPTGYLHIGSARTALFSWLYARKHKGVFILRIEDTDRERSTEAAVNAILDGMDWLGLKCDEGPFFQTQRFDRYREVTQALLGQDKAYRCDCSKERLERLRAEQMARKEKPRYDGHCRDRTEPVPENVRSVIRFKNPLDGEVIVNDQMRGKVVFQNKELDDLIIARADGTPTYNLTVVVDDMDMQITDVIRGDDHLNNTPRQINIFKALDIAPPRYAHVPMILGPDGKRLSKRHGAVSVLQYREDGYLPEALLNYLVRLGWSHGDEEIFSVDEMIEKFDLSKVNKSAATFDPDKLLWLNQHYLKTDDVEYVADRLRVHLEKLGLDLKNGPLVTEVVKAQRDRAKTLKEMAGNSAFFYREPEGYEAKAAAKYLEPGALEPLTALRERLAPLNNWTTDAIHTAISRVAEQLAMKLGNIAQPLRVALSGGAVSPPIDVTVELVGQDRVLKRIDVALAYIRDSRLS